jgi:hypothetical protein
MGMITTNAMVSSQKFTLIHSGEAREKLRGARHWQSVWSALFWSDVVQT